jgi:hypothetical protein
MPWFLEREREREREIDIIRVTCSHMLSMHVVVFTPKSMNLDFKDWVYIRKMYNTTY